MEPPAGVVVRTWLSSAAAFQLEPIDIGRLMLLSRQWRDEVGPERPALLRAYLAAEGAEGWLAVSSSTIKDHAELIVLSSSVRVPVAVRAIHAMKAAAARLTTDPYRRSLECMTDGSLLAAGATSAGRGGEGRVLNTIVTLSMLYAYAAALHVSTSPATVDVRPWAAIAMFHYVGLTYAGTAPSCKSQAVAGLLLRQLDDVLATEWSGRNGRLHERLVWLLRRVRRKLSRYMLA